jgi:hypothetical protein
VNPGAKRGRLKPGLLNEEIDSRAQNRKNE